MWIKKEWKKEGNEKREKKRKEKEGYENGKIERNKRKEKRRKDTDYRGADDTSLCLTVFSSQIETLVSFRSVHLYTSLLH